GKPPVVAYTLHQKHAKPKSPMLTILVDPVMVAHNKHAHQTHQPNANGNLRIHPVPLPITLHHPSNREGERCVCATAYTVRRTDPDPIPTTIDHTIQPDIDQP